MNALWVGSLPIERVTWVYSNERPIFPKAIHEYAKQLFETQKKEHPQMYDGDILWLSDFKVLNEQMVLIISSVKFSEVMTLHAFQVREYKGQFGFKAVIRNRNGKILLGKRNLKSKFKLGFFQMPGGILEKLDSTNPFVEACFRELNEEIDRGFDPQMYV